MLKLFNTESREKEDFQPMEGKQVKMYTCGPTVYNYAHIGNFRTYVFEDLLRRSLKFFGYQVTQVMNLTDVDDKTIRGATEQGVSLLEFTEPFKKAFFDDLSALRIERVEQYPAATDYVPQMIAFIQKLMDKGAAYQGSDGSVYFSITKFPRYGCLSNLDLSSLQAGASQRVDSDEYDKECLSDFVLWKAYDAERDGAIYWDSPFGKGRPGWHLECSTMAREILGDSLDIHVGGVDNIFPHHENEIAQSEIHNSCRFARLWLHAEHLLVENKKMSKSLGNFFTLRDLQEKGFSGAELRYMLIQTHYRTQLNFTIEGLEGARHSLGRIRDFVLRLKDWEGAGANDAQEICKRAGERFGASLADDLNIAQALAVLFDLIREVNILCDKKELSSGGAANLLNLLDSWNSVLAFIDFERDSIPQEILEAAQARQQARKDKDWAKADQLRDWIADHGFAVEDTPKGPVVKKKAGV